MYGGEEGGAVPVALEPCGGLAVGGERDAVLVDVAMERLDHR